MLAASPRGTAARAAPGGATAGGAARSVGRAPIHRRASSFGVRARSIRSVTIPARSCLGASFRWSLFASLGSWPVLLSPELLLAAFFLALLPLVAALLLAFKPVLAALFLPLLPQEISKVCQVVRQVAALQNLKQLIRVNLSSPSQPRGKVALLEEHPQAGREVIPLQQHLQPRRQRIGGDRRARG